MNWILSRYSVAVLFVAVVVGGLATMSHLQPAFGRAEDKATVSGAHFTVVETEGHNLIVTDNATNTLYFYTVDKGEPVGADLKLRGKLDLTQVGKPTLKPIAINIQK